MQAQLNSGADQVPRVLGRYPEYRRTEVPCPSLPEAVTVAPDAGAYRLSAGIDESVALVAGLMNARFLDSMEKRKTYRR